MTRIKTLLPLGRFVNPVGITCALGITSMILWCKLMGHTSAFYVPLAGLGTWANARVFWLAGILVAALVCLLLPRALHRVDAMQRYVIPLIAMVGAAMFALAFHQDFFDQRLFAVAGVVTSGFGYFWFISRFVLLLALTQGVACLAWAFGAAFVLRQILLVLMDAFIPLDYQVMVAIVLPLCAVAFLELACVAARSADRRALEDVKRAGCELPVAGGLLWGVRTLPKERRIERDEGRYLLVMVVAAGLLLSVARACSISGTWGSDHTAGLSLATAVPTIALYALAVCVLVYIGVVRMARVHETYRFVAGVLITMTGLLVAALRPSLTWFPDMLLDAVVGTNDPFALVFFWSMVAAAIQRLAVPPNRVIGLAGSVYAAASIVWVFLISGDNAVSSAFVLSAVYVLFVLFVVMLRLQGKAGETPLALTPYVVGAGGARSDGLSEIEEEPPDASAALMAAIEGRCAELACAYGLSPREADVLLLIAQGRSGGAIQDELGVAGSTVKTHTQHIYGKLGVGDRQELMDLVLGRR